MTTSPSQVRRSWRGHNQICLPSEQVSRQAGQELVSRGGAAAGGGSADQTEAGGGQAAQLQAADRQHRHWISAASRGGPRIWRLSLPESAPEHQVQCPLSSALTTTTVLCLRLNAKLASLELERLSGVSLNTPARFPARLRAKTGPTSARPQFEAAGLLPERFNRYYSGQRQDRTQQRNSGTAPGLSVSKPLPFSSRSHLTTSGLLPNGPADSSGFSFKFEVQHSS